MEKNSLEYLNSTRWYRFLKIVFIATFLLSQIVFLVENFGEIQKEVPVLNTERRAQLDGIVLKMTQQNATEQEIQLIVDDFKLKYATDVKMVVVKERLVYALVGFLVYFTVVSIIFLIIRQAFLYVSIGSFRKLK